MMTMLLHNTDLKGNELEVFAEWAFGREFEDLYTSIGYMLAWNTYHGKDLRLHEEGIPEDDLPKMVALWRIASVT